MGLADAKLKRGPGGLKLAVSLSVYVQEKELIGDLLMARIFAPGVLAVSLFAAGASLADDNGCRSPMSQWQPQGSAMQYAERLGLHVKRIKIDDGCYEITGYDQDGNRIEMEFDPASFAATKLEVQFRSGADPSRYLAGVLGARAGNNPQVNVE